MLVIKVPGTEVYDESLNLFSTIDDVVLELEHSLVSLSKWEQTFEVPFLSGEDKTPEQVIGYIKAMTLTPDVSDDTYAKLTKENFEEINAYVDKKMSATWFTEVKRGNRTGEIITSELIYYWMTAFQIPLEAETWHLNRLFNLIRIASIKQEKPKKMGRADAAAQRRQLNAQRRAELGTKG